MADFVSLPLIDTSKARALQVIRGAEESNGDLLKEIFDGCFKFSQELHAESIAEESRDDMV